MNQAALTKRILLIVAAAVLPATLWSFSINPRSAMLFSLIALFLALKECSPKVGWRLGLLYGFLLYSISLSWLWEIFPGVSIVLWIMLALFTGVFGGVFAWVQSQQKDLRLLAPGAAACWTALEYYRSEWFQMRFPWITPGTSQGPLWLHSVLGVYGVSFLMVLLAIIWVYSKNRLPKYILSLFLVIILLIRPTTTKDSKEMGISVMAIQRENCDFTSYYEDTVASDFRDGVILWPEYSTCSDIRGIMINRPAPLTGVEMLRRIAEERNVTFIVGAISPSGKDVPWNEAIVIDQSGEIGTHYKNRPVHMMLDGIPGTTQNPVMTQWGNVGSPICFDNDYTEVPRRFVRNGAEVFLVPSLDAEYWTARQHRQHGEIFRLRAVETGRWYVVCATSGLSQCIRPDGTRVQELPLMEDAIMRSVAYKRQDRTFYVQYGWMFPWLSCGIALIFLVGVTILALRSRKFQKNPALA